MPILWWCLEVETQVALMKFQWDKYGFRLSIPPFPPEPKFNPTYDTLEEIDKTIRQRPYGLKKVK